MTVIRGAISAETDTEEEISSAAVRLYKEIINRNCCKEIIAVFASQTADLRSFNCCTALRLKCNVSCALECFQEAFIENQLPKIIRLSVFCNGNFPPINVYLEKAAQLRPDLLIKSEASN